MPPTPSPPRPAPGTPTILVVEDNEDVAIFAETLLSELGHKVTRAATGEEVLAIARKKRFDIVLSDIVEGGSGGRPVILKPYRLATLSDELPDAMRR